MPFAPSPVQPTLSLRVGELSSKAASRAAQAQRQELHRLAKDAKELRTFAACDPRIGAPDADAALRALLEPTVDLESRAAPAISYVLSKESDRRQDVSTAQEAITKLSDVLDAIEDRLEASHNIPRVKLPAAATSAPSRPSSSDALESHLSTSSLDILEPPLDSPSSPMQAPLSLADVGLVEVLHKEDRLETCIPQLASKALNPEPAPPTSPAVLGSNFLSMAVAAQHESPPKPSPKPAASPVLPPTPPDFVLPPLTRPVIADSGSAGNTASTIANSSNSMGGPELPSTQAGDPSNHGSQGLGLPPDDVGLADDLSLGVQTPPHSNSANLAPGLPERRTLSFDTPDITTSALRRTRSRTRRAAAQTTISERYAGLPKFLRAKTSQEAVSEACLRLNEAHERAGLTRPLSMTREELSATLALIVETEDALNMLIFALSKLDLIETKKQHRQATYYVFGG